MSATFIQQPFRPVLATLPVDTRRQTQPHTAQFRARAHRRPRPAQEACQSGEGPTNMGVHASRHDASCADKAESADKAARSPLQSSQTTPEMEICTPDDILCTDSSSVVAQTATGAAASDSVQPAARTVVQPSGCSPIAPQPQREAPSPSATDALQTTTASPVPLVAVTETNQPTASDENAPPAAHTGGSISKGISLLG